MKACTKFVCSPRTRVVEVCWTSGKVFLIKFCRVLCSPGARLCTVLLSITISPLFNVKSCLFVITCQNQEFPLTWHYLECREHGLWMSTWSFSRVHELRDIFRPLFAFQQWNKCYSWYMKMKKKKHLSEWAWCQKAIGGFYFTKKRRAETLQPGSEFDNFKPRLKSSIFKFISWLNGSFLGGLMMVF